MKLIWQCVEYYNVEKQNTKECEFDVKINHISLMVVIVLLFLFSFSNIIEDIYIWNLIFHLQVLEGLNGLKCLYKNMKNCSVGWLL